MKKTLLLAVFAFATAISGTAGVTAWGYRNYQLGVDGGGSKGPVTFDVAAPGTLTLLADQTRLGSIYAAVYHNYKWYAQVTKPGTQSTPEAFVTIDMVTGERKFHAPASTHVTEMTYDYAGNKVFAISSNAENLMTVDLETGKVTKVGAFRDASYNYPYVVALACALDGTLYGISTDGNLYTIAQDSGLLTLVGPTGVNVAYTQCMEFDRNNGVLYWINANDHTLYTVDTATGTATRIAMTGVPSDDDSVQSLVIPFINVPKGAPDRVTDRQARVVDGAVQLSWTNPVTDAQGQPLTELTSVKISRDGTLVATVPATVGTQMTYTDSTPVQGLNRYTLTPVNSHGDGGVDTDPLDICVGLNPPAAVGNWNVLPGDNTAEISWTAPTAGMYGGEYDPSALTGYIITRKGASAKTINVDAAATSYSDKPASFGKYTYSIQGVNPSGTGAASAETEIMVKPADWILMTTTTETLDIGKDYKFYDIGGPNGNYPNSANETLTVRPSQPGAAVKASFTAMNIDDFGDYLKIYNGPAAVDSALIGKFNGTTVPVALQSVTSTAPDGSLTFVFYSDVYDNRTGWTATLTAVAKAEVDLTAGTLTAPAYPNVGQQDVKFTLEVHNSGLRKVLGSEYAVNVADAAGNVLAQGPGADVEPVATVQVDIAYTPLEAGNYVVTATIACDGDANTADNNSAPVSLSVMAAGDKLVAIGQNTSEVMVFPASFSSSDCLTQIIYYKDEIGLEAGTLKSIAYPISACDKEFATAPVTIWMTETELADLNEQSIPSSQMTKVYEGNNPFLSGMDEWKFVLDTPFDYHGGNLAVSVHKGDCGDKTYGNKFWGTFGNYQADPKRSRLATKFFDYDVIDPDTNNFGSPNVQWPNTRLLFSTDEGGIVDVTIGAEGSDGFDPALPVDYYNLQGQPVGNPSIGGLYIGVQCGKAQKVRIRR